MLKRYVSAAKSNKRLVSIKGLPPVTLPIKEPHGRQTLKKITLAYRHYGRWSLKIWWKNTKNWFGLIAMGRFTWKLYPACLNRQMVGFYKSNLNCGGEFTAAEPVIQAFAQLVYYRTVQFAGRTAQKFVTKRISPKGILKYDGKRPFKAFNNIKRILILSLLI